MKKFISLFLTLMLCISMVLIVTSCGAKHPIEEFKSKMEDADSYQMSVTMSNVPLFGTITMTTKYDGNIQYTPASMFDEEEYIETVGNIKYKYTKNEDGTWSKTQDTEEEDDSGVTGDKTMEELFNPDNYEKVKDKENTYKQKKDVTFDNFEDVTLTIEENSCTIEMASTDEGYGVKLVISKIGEIELTLPTVG